MALIIHATREEKVDVSPRENESAEVPDITTKVVRRTNKLVKKVSKHQERRPELKTWKWNRQGWGEVAKRRHLKYS